MLRKKLNCELLDNNILSNNNTNTGLLESMQKGLVFNVKMLYQMDVQFEVMPQ